MSSRFVTYAALWAALTMLASPAAAHFATFDGLYYDLQGAATTSLGPGGELIVSNLGTSGLDGISLVMPDGGRGMIFDHEWGHPVGLGVTTRRVIAMKNMVTGAAQMDGLRITLDVDDGGVSVTADDPEGGATGILLDVTSLNGESYREYLALAAPLRLEDPTTPAAALESMSGGAGEPRPLFAIKDQGIKIAAESPTLQYVRICFDHDVRVRTPAQPGGVMGNALRLARTSGTPIVRIVAVTITGSGSPGSGVGSFAIQEQGVKVYDGVVRALHDVTLEDPDGDGVMRAVGFGSSGLDGIRVEPDPDAPEHHATEIGLKIQELQFLQPPTPASRLTIEATGSVGGGPAQAIGRLHLARPADDVTITPDFSPIGASTWGAIVLDHGVVVAELGGLSGNVVVTSRKAMLQWYLDMVSVRLDDGATPPVFTFGASTYAGNELRIAPETGPHAQMADYFLKLEGRAAYLVSLGIEDVVALPGGPIVSAVPAARPVDLDLRAPWPNPARGDVSVEFAIERAAVVHAAVHDLAGRRVRTLVAGSFAPGLHRVTWDGRDDQGQATAPGLYFVRIERGGAARSKPVVRVQ